MEKSPWETKRQNKTYAYFWVFKEICTTSEWSLIWYIKIIINHVYYNCNNLFSIVLTFI